MNSGLIITIIIIVVGFIGGYMLGEWFKNTFRRK